MRRVVLTSSLVSACVSALVTILALSAVAPAIVGAQGSQISGDEIVAVGPEGQPRARLGTTPASGGGEVRIFAADGTVRAAMTTGGMGDLASAGVNVLNPNGVVVARLGASVLGSTDIPQPHVRLRDSSNNNRLLAFLDEEGNPSIQLLDAAGNVLWSAP